MSQTPLLTINSVTINFHGSVNISVKEAKKIIPENVEVPCDKICLSVVSPKVPEGAATDTLCVSEHGDSPKLTLVRPSYAKMA